MNIFPMGQVPDHGASQSFILADITIASLAAKKDNTILSLNNLKFEVPAGLHWPCNYTPAVACSADNQTGTTSRTSACDH